MTIFRYCRLAFCVAILLSSGSACSRGFDVSSATHSPDAQRGNLVSAATSGIEVVQGANVRTYGVDHPPQAKRSGVELVTSEPEKLSTSLLFLHRIDSSAIQALVVSPDGTTSITGHDDGTIYYHRLVNEAVLSGSGKETGPYFVTELLGRSASPVLALSLSPSGRYLAVGQVSRVSIIDLQARSVARTLTRVVGRVTAVQFDPTEELLSFGLANGEVYVWNLVLGPDAGEDSLRAVESYFGGRASIIRLLFHPSGRSLFVAEADGTLSVWRLLRTERELGIRDDRALVDRRGYGRWRFVFSKVPAMVKDMRLSRDGNWLLVAAADGGVYRWKMRGLRQQDGYKAQESAVFSVAEVSISEQGRSSVMLVTSGRGGLLRIWCENQAVSQGDDAESSIISPGEAELEEDAALEEETEESQGVTSDPTLGPVSTTSRDILGQAVVDENVRARNAVPGGSLKSPILQPLAEFEQLQLAIVQLASGKDSTILWAAQKTGNLLAFDSKALLNNPQWKQVNKACLR